MRVRLWSWEEDELWFYSATVGRDQSGGRWAPSSLHEAADALPPTAYACLATRWARQAQPLESGRVILRVSSDAAADRVEEIMAAARWKLDSAIKWSPEERGGSMFFSPPIDESI